jgi:hypothetical protein
MLPAIIESMKDSPDEMNRKRYLVFVDLIAELVSCQNQLTKLKNELAWARESNSKPFSSWAGDHYGI